MQTTEDGSLLLKPALHREIDFYQLIAAASDDDPLSKLRKWIPKFLGVLKLEGKLKDTNGNRNGNEGDGNLEIVPVSAGIAPEEKDMLICFALSTCAGILILSITVLSFGKSFVWFRETLYPRREAWDRSLWRGRVSRKESAHDQESS